MVFISTGVATSEDHDAFTTNITFGECSRRECTYITVFDDMSLERQETFSLSLLRLPGNDRILLDVVEKVVTIFDTDSKTVSHVFLYSLKVYAAGITIDFDDPGVVVESYALEVCLIIEGAPTSACPSSVPLRVSCKLMMALLVSLVCVVHDWTHWKILNISLYF